MNESAPLDTGFSPLSSLEEAPLLRVESVVASYGDRPVLNGVSVDLWPGEILGIVGESGAGKSTFLRCVSGQMPPDAGHIWYQPSPEEPPLDLYQLREPEKRRLLRTDWGVVHQDPTEGLRMTVSAGGNVCERMIAAGQRDYGALRRSAGSWLQRVEIGLDRIDDLPSTFSGGMRQRTQLARNLASTPRLLFLDEPTGGLDVSVQAKLLDLLRRLTQELGVACLLVTHDLGVVRLLASRLVVMQGGLIVEAGLTDQILEDPQHPYSQLLVSSVLRT